MRTNTDYCDQCGQNLDLFKKQYDLRYLLDAARHAIETPGDFSPDDISELLNDIDNILKVEADNEN